jgi:hypothetical protein
MQQPRVRSFSFLNPLKTHQPQVRGPVPNVFGSTTGRYVKSDNRRKKLARCKFGTLQRDASVSPASTDLKASLEATCFVGNRSLNKSTYRVSNAISQAAVSALLFGALGGELHSAILRIAADDAG